MQFRDRLVLVQRPHAGSTGSFLPARGFYKPLYKLRIHIPSFFEFTRERFLPGNAYKSCLHAAPGHRPNIFRLHDFAGKEQHDHRHRRACHHPFA